MNIEQVPDQNSFNFDPKIVADEMWSRKNIDEVFNTTLKQFDSSKKDDKLSEIEHLFSTVLSILEPDLEIFGRSNSSTSDKKSEVKNAVKNELKLKILDYIKDMKLLNGEPRYLQEEIDNLFNKFY